MKELGELIADKVRYLRWKSAVKTVEKAKSFSQPYGGLSNVPPIQGNFIWPVSWRRLGKQWSDPFGIAPESPANTELDTAAI